MLGRVHQDVPAERLLHLRQERLGLAQIAALQMHPMRRRRCGPADQRVVHPDPPGQPGRCDLEGLLDVLELGPAGRPAREVDLVGIQLDEPLPLAVGVGADHQVAGRVQPEVVVQVLDEAADGGRVAHGGLRDPAPDHLVQQTGRSVRHRYEAVVHRGSPLPRSGG
jgi:hypothetical protein